MNNQKEVMLSTIDNPYDYFTQFDEWYDYDMIKGYSTCCYLARVAKIGDAMTDDEKFREIERAVDEIIKYDPLGIYIKVTKKD